jgi:AraC-like DNA-binding protein
MTALLYEEINPDKSLKDFVKRFWKVSNLTEDKKNPTILPDGYFDLIIKIVNNKLDSILLTGFYTKEFEAETLPNSAFIGVSFLPLAAEYIFQQSISSYLNKHEPMPPDFWDLDKIDFTNFKHWSHQVSEKISEHATNKIVDDRKQKLFHLLFQTKGSLTVQKISDQLFWNSRQINRYFKTKFGLSLKAYSNILRCKATYNDIKKGDLFPKENFSDQAHFITEIKKHTGTTPKVLSKNKNDRFIQFSTRTT